MYGIFFIGFFLPTVAQFFGIEKLYFDAPHSAWIRSLRYCGHFLELSGSESFRSSGISAADVCTTSLSIYTFLFFCRDMMFWIFFSIY